jgi:hypothetical protein
MTEQGYAARGVVKNGESKLVTAAAIGGDAAEGSAIRLQPGEPASAEPMPAASGSTTALIAKVADSSAPALARFDGQEQPTASAPHSAQPKSEAQVGAGPEPPRPLTRELPPPRPFPVKALGKLLESAARAIQDCMRAPLAICGRSVLAAATLAVKAVTLSADKQRTMVANSLAQPKPAKAFIAALRNAEVESRPMRGNTTWAANAMGFSLGTMRPDRDAIEELTPEAMHDRVQASLAIGALGDA